MKKLLVSFLLLGAISSQADTTFEINAKLPDSNQGVVSTEFRAKEGSVTAAPSPTPTTAASTSPTTTDSRPVIGAAASSDSSVVSDTVSPAQDGAPAQGAPVKLFKTLEEANAAGVNPLKPVVEPTAPLPELSAFDTFMAKVFKSYREIGLFSLLAVLLIISATLWSRRRSQKSSE